MLPNLFLSVIFFTIGSASFSQNLPRSTASQKPNASQEAEKLWIWFDKNYSVYETSFLSYKFSMPKTDPRVSILNNSMNKELWKKQVEAQVIKQLETEFTLSELKYLNETLDHRLFQRFEEFRKKLIPKTAKEAIENAVQTQLKQKKKL